MENARSKEKEKTDEIISPHVMSKVFDMMKWDNKHTPHTESFSAYVLTYLQHNFTFFLACFIEWLGLEGTLRVI